MKAHSERVKSKNFRQIAGKPLFRWILDTLADVDEIDRIVINTDAREILAENNLHHGDYGGRLIIRDRKPDICGDHVSMNLILQDDIRNVPSDIYFMTHTTNPLLSKETIKVMLDRYDEEVLRGNKDSLFTVTRHQTRFYAPDTTPINHDPANLLRTQDLPAFFEENSVGYMFSTQSFASTMARIGKNPGMFETPALESVDIDEPSDWYMAESLLLRIRNGQTLPKE